MIYYNPILYKHKTGDKYTKGWLYIRLREIPSFENKPIYEYTKVNYLFLKFFKRDKNFTFQDTKEDMINI